MKVNITDYSKWQISPMSGERIYSTTDIAETYGVSAQLLNKVLVKLGILIPLNKEHQMYKISDELYGEECHFNTKYHYDSYANDYTTNVTIKFSEFGKQYIDKILQTQLHLISICDPNKTYNELESYFPEGKYAIAIRLPGTTYNPNPNGKIKIYIANRDSRNGCDFTKFYLFIPDDLAAIFKQEIKEWEESHHIYNFSTNYKSTKNKYNKKNYNNTGYIKKGYMMDWDDSLQATFIIIETEKYFKSIMEKAGYTFILSDVEKEQNKKLLQDFLNNEI